MKFFDIRGRLVNKNLNKYLIKWDSQSRSKLQFKVKQFLKPYWMGSICYEECPVFGTLLRVDILNATYKIAIEVNGPQHEKLHYFHNGNPFEFLAGIKRDVQKRDWLEKNGFKVIEINYDEVDILTKKFFKDKFGVIL